MLGRFSLAVNSLRRARGALGCRSFLRRLPQRVQRQKNCRCRDRHVGNIENAGAQRTDADIQKIDHAAVINNTVDKVAKAAAA